jgi:hypothetical protein
MKTFDVTFEEGGIYQSNIVTADSECAVRDWFAANRPAVHVLNVREATSDSHKPGKPCITV